MSLHTIKITETRVRFITLDTDFDFEAMSKVELMYANGEITLDDDMYILNFNIETEEN